MLYGEFGVSKSALIALAVILTVFTGLFFRLEASSPGPAVGRRVYVHGRMMHLSCTGAGYPAVILEAPQTGLLATWAPVQDGISEFAQTCSYDRAGFGFSDPGPVPRTSARIAAELHDLLTTAGIRKPYVLVGASAGGFHVRVYAGNYPDEVAGMVLVDSSHPDQARRLKLPENPTAEFRRWEPLLPLTHATGILRLGLKREPRPAAFSPSQWAELLDARDQTNSYRTLLREGEAWTESANQVRNSGNLGAKPLLVLTGARDADAETRGLWVHGLQADLTHLSSNGRQVILENSGHGIQFDAPKEVVDAVRSVWRQCRAALAEREYQR